MDRRQFTAAVMANAFAPEPVRDKSPSPAHWGVQYYDDKERQAVVEVVETGQPFRFTSGKNTPSKVAAFEKEFAARMGTRYALGVTSGTTALETAVTALGIGPGDEVILPAWTWHATATAVIRAGALPVFAEIDESFNLDPADIEHRITPQTKLLIPVHLQGNPADMDPILAIARRHNLKVLEDCAQCVGGSYKGKPVGSLGDMGIYSHQLTKTITAGEGGTVVTSDPVLFERAVRFHNAGNLAAPHQAWLGESRVSPFASTNFRMNEFTGGVMLAQLRKLDTIVAGVRESARRVYDGIRDLPGIKFRRLPDPRGELGTVVFVGFDSKARCDRFVKAMNAERIPVSRPGGSIILPIAPYIENKIAMHPNWPTWTSPRGKAIRYGAASCPRTIDILGRFAGPALGPKYTRRETDNIVAAIRKVFPAVV